MSWIHRRSILVSAGRLSRIGLPVATLLVTVFVALAAAPAARPAASFTTPRVCGFVTGPKVGTSSAWLVVATKGVECVFAKVWMARLSRLPVGADLDQWSGPKWASCLKATSYSISCADAEEAPGDYMSGTACGHPKTKRLCTTVRRGGKLFR